jgi:tRNA(fMet)-specific endonuclease VapC
VNRILLDTSGYSAFMRGSEEVKMAVQRAEELYLNPIVVGELLAGFLRGANRRRNERELQTLLASPRVDILSVDDETARRYAVIVHTLRAAGTPIPTNDVWNAASAMQHGLRIVTTDKHYTRVPQVIVDCFDA